VEQPGGAGQVEERDPIGEHQELTDQEQEKADVDRVAAEREYARGHQPTGALDVDADPEAFAECHQAEHQDQHTAQAQSHSQPGDSGRLEEPLAAGQGPTEGGGEHRIEVEQSHRWYQEVRLVELPEMHCLSAGSAQQQDSAEHRADQEHAHECGQILRHCPIMAPPPRIDFALLFPRRGRRVTVGLWRQTRKALPNICATHWTGVGMT
jgi:hypothetical protein